MEFSKILDASLDGLKYVKSFHVPVHCVKTACGLGEKIESVSSVCEGVKKRFTLVSGSLHAVSLVTYGVSLARLPVYDPARAAELGCSMMKKVCEIALWAQWCKLAPMEASHARQLTGTRLVAGMAKSSLRLWKDLHATPKDRKLAISIPKFLKCSLLLFAHLVDNKRVSLYMTLTAKAIGIVREGVTFYQFIQKISYHPSDWNLDSAKICKVIFSITLSGVAFYTLERTVDFSSLS